MDAGYIVISATYEGRALGRESFKDALGWVDMPFASVFVDEDEARYFARYWGIRDYKVEEVG